MRVVVFLSIQQISSLMFVCSLTIFINSSRVLLCSLHSQLSRPRWFITVAEDRLWCHTEIVSLSLRGLLHSHMLQLKVTEVVCILISPEHFQNLHFYMLVPLLSCKLCFFSLKKSYFYFRCRKVAFDQILLCLVLLLHLSLLHRWQAAQGTVWCAVDCGACS